MKRAPRVFNRSNHDAPSGAVYVGRPTKFGNPWSDKDSSFGGVTVVKTRIEAISKFIDYIMADTPHAIALRADVRKELRGKDLECWCAPDDCHAEILIEIANAP